LRICGAWQVLFGSEVSTHSLVRFRPLPISRPNLFPICDHFSPICGQKIPTPFCDYCALSRLKVSRSHLRKIATSAVNKSGFPFVIFAPLCGKEFDSPVPPSQSLTIFPLQPSLEVSRPANRNLKLQTSGVQNRPSEDMFLLRPRRRRYPGDVQRMWNTFNGARTTGGTVKGSVPHTVTFAPETEKGF
jgi:hypothetical protein